MECFLESSSTARLFSAAGWEKGVQSPPGGVVERGPEWVSFCPLVWLGSRRMGRALPTHPSLEENWERVRRCLFPETLRYLPQNTVPAKRKTNQSKHVQFVVGNGNPGIGPRVFAPESPRPHQRQSKRVLPPHSWSGGIWLREPGRV